MKKAILWLGLITLLALLSVRFISSTAEEASGDDEVLRCDATELEQTFVAPHMHVPIVGRNVLWCGTFQLVWNEACTLVGEDLHFAPPEPALVSPMNQKEFTAAQIDQASHVAIADFVRNDVHGQIARALKKKFPNLTPRYVPDRSLTPRPQDIVAYGCLFKHLEFETPFERIESPLLFGATPVACFGVGEEYKPDHDKLLDQFVILDYADSSDFIIELKTKSQGDRLILAKVPPEPTLMLTVRGVHQRIAAATPVEPQVGDVLLVPKFDFDIMRRFHEIEGKPLVVQNPAVAPDLVILSALQNIRFQMNEQGVRLESESHMAGGCAAPPDPERLLIFDKPFLVLLQRADAELPYFAAWIANAELLVEAAESATAGGVDR